jgi:flagellar protein FlgJ
MRRRAAASPTSAKGRVLALTVDQNLQLATMQAQAARQDAAAGSAKGMGSAKGISVAKEKHTRADVKQVAEEFESLFLGIVLKSMRDTVGKSGLMDGGNAEDIYRSMLDTEYAKQMAAQRHTGIADNVESFLLEAQGLKPEPKPWEKLKAAAKAAEGATGGAGAVNPLTAASPKALARKAYEASGLREAAKSATITDGAPWKLPR